MNDKTGVVIVGGGPVGLTLAHCFSKAGIGFEILEAGDSVFPAIGSSLILYPSTARVYEQLGIWEDFKKIATPVTQGRLFTYDGTPYHVGHLGPNFEALYGMPPQAFHRETLLRVLYDTLPAEAKERVHTSKKVMNIDTKPDGVTVYCTDDSVYEGSIVIGADGVHSKTRGLMRDLALKASPDSKVNPEQPYIRKYRCMWGHAPRPEAIGVGEYHDCHAARCSSMVIGSPERCWFFLYEYLDETVPDEKRGYDEKDMEEYAERFEDMHITQNLKFRDLWRTRLSSGMGNLDEGVLEHWSWDRIVLAGDAAHKITPNTGLGYNAGVQDAVALTNLLYELKEGKKEFRPTTEELGLVFRRYQDMRKKLMESTWQLSAITTRQAAWPNERGAWVYRFMEWCLTFIPKFEWLMARFVGSRLERTGLVLDFVSGEEPCTGMIPVMNSFFCLYTGLLREELIVMDFLHFWERND